VLRTKIQYTDAASRPLSAILRSGLPQKRIAARAVIARFGEQKVECEAGEVVRNRLGVTVFFLVENLAIGVAFVAALGTDRLRTAYDRLVSNTPGRLAV